MASIPDDYALIIPALNEEKSIGLLVRQIPRGLFRQVIVVDNGSDDSTAEVARTAGAQVIREERRGYGRACMTGILQLLPSTAAVAFMDGDLADDPADLVHLVRYFDHGQFDLVIGSRVLGNSEPGALTPLQRFGNWLTTHLIRAIWHVSYTDLGPLRILHRSALERLDLRDRTFGWNVEMQAKAARLRLKLAEVPVSYRRRRHGKSKISGTLWGSVRAGIKILWTVFRCWLTFVGEDRPTEPSGF